MKYQILHRHSFYIDPCFRCLQHVAPDQANSFAKNLIAELGKFTRKEEFEKIYNSDKDVLEDSPDDTPQTEIPIQPPPQDKEIDPNDKMIRKSLKRGTRKKPAHRRRTLR